MRRMYDLLIFMSFIFANSMSFAALNYEVQDSNIMAKVDDVVLTKNSVEIIHNLVKQKEPNVSISSLMRGLIENRVISAQAEREFSDAELSGESQQRVGYSTEVTLINQLVNAIRHSYHRPIERSIQMLKGGTLDSTLLFLANFDNPELHKLVELRDKLKYQLTSTQEVTAKSFVVLKYQFPDSDIQSASLWDIYQRQNVQGRIAIHERDKQFLDQQIRRYVMQAYVMHWAKTQSGLSTQDLISLSTLLKDKRHKEQYLQRKGLLVDIHDDNPAVKKLAEQVTFKEIQQYYNAHKVEFKTIEKVQAQHIRLSSQEKADQVYREIEKGLAFDDAVRRYSIADDKNLVPAGDLGWIVKEDRKNSWLKGITFVQREGIVSRPFRSPQVGNQPVYWEIVKVREKITGFQPVESEGVRYQASKVIARQKAADLFEENKQKLLASADISLNKRYVDDQAYLNAGKKIRYQQLNTHHHHPH